MSIVVPTIGDYRKAIGSEIYADMERYSDLFLRCNGQHLIDYAKKWVSDPLHQWSRQWEYVYTFLEVAEGEAKSTPPKQVLDAGAGLTFFPYYVKNRLNVLRMECCDYDRSLDAVYRKVNNNWEDRVTFSNEDLKHITYDSQAFDVIYCISVLEHTDDYSKIVNEFYRDIKPGGRLIVTFDISLDGGGDISIERAHELAEVLLEVFDLDKSEAKQLASSLSSADILTTAYAAEMKAELIPWKRPSVSARVKYFAK